MLYFGVDKVDVIAGAAVYPVFVGVDLIRNLGPIVAERIPSKRCALITDRIIGPLLAAQVEQSLTTAGIETVEISIPAGEQAKTLQQTGLICDQMITAGLDRRSFVIWFCGGGVGGIFGVLGFTFLRGGPP